MELWDNWKKGFDVWEQKTADLLESMLKTETVLAPVGTLLTASLKVKAASERAAAQWWAAWGLPTRRDQERTLHALNQLQSRLTDLEERLAQMQKH